MLPVYLPKEKGGVRASERLQLYRRNRSPSYFVTVTGAVSLNVTTDSAGMTMSLLPVNAAPAVPAPAPASAPIAAPLPPPANPPIRAPAPAPPPIKPAVRLPLPFSSFRYGLVDTSCPPIWDT